MYFAVAIAKNEQNIKPVHRFYILFIFLRLQQQNTCRTSACMYLLLKTCFQLIVERIWKTEPSDIERTYKVKN